MALPSKRVKRERTMQDEELMNHYRNIIKYMPHHLETIREIVTMSNRDGEAITDWQMERIYHATDKIIKV